MDYIPLRMGAMGPAVEQVQKTLEALGYSVGEIDGRFGLSTRNAVSAFQTDHELPVDGVVAKNTWDALEKMSGDTWVVKQGEPEAAAEAPAPEEAVPERAAEEAPPVERRGPERPVRTVPLIQWDPVPEPEPAVRVTVEEAAEQVEAAPPAEEIVEEVEVVTPAPVAKTEEGVEAPAAPAPAAGLRMGSRNSQVMELQRRLGELGYYTGALTGYFGELTYRSLTRYQRENGLPATGVGDQATMDKLRAQREPGVLSKGDRGEAVTQLQKDLQALGHYPSEICGIFGDETLEGVIAFQTRVGLPPTGRVNRRTWDAMEAALRQEDAVTAASEIIVLRPGDSGREVLAMQRGLQELGFYTGVLDGVYGSGTTIAVENFQRENGLLADGIAGPATLDALERQAGDSEDIPDQTFTELREGSSGEEVRLLQDRLKQLGIFAPSITGSFGPATATSVKRFQEDNGLPVTGVVDAQVWDALIKQTAPPIDMALPPHGASRPTIRYGDTGEDVERLQQELYTLMYYRGEINGVFDSDTLVAVKSFQDAHRLSPDGVVGAMTWNALIALYPPPVVCD